MTSAHAYSMDFLAALPQMIELAKETGIRQFVCKPPRECTQDALSAFAMKTIHLADRLSEAGIQLLLHNEEHEIRTVIDGQTAFEWLLDACGSKVSAQVDVGWVMRAGADPEALLWRLGNRVASVHYNDFDTAGKETTVGSGQLNILPCLQFARAHGCTQIVDMEHCTLLQLKQSIAALNVYRSRREKTISILSILDTQTGQTTDLRSFDGIIEAPNWSVDGKMLYYNADGYIWKYSLDSGSIVRLNTGECNHCNNDHVLSPDGAFIAVSHQPDDDNRSLIYKVGLDSGSVSLITPNAPSYLHGWSPDGKKLSYCAFRPSSKPGAEWDVDVYVISADGGKEVCLTHGVGFNDGPEFSPDGRYIWFNSTRSGLMQLWRMKSDGSEPTQMTFSEENNWFGHISPDGKKVLMLAFRKNDLEPHEHLPNMHVSLNLMNTDGTDFHQLLTLFGGQGTINVNSWSPDSRHAAFVHYKLLHS